MRQESEAKDAAATDISPTAVALEPARGPQDPSWLQFCEEVERMNRNPRYIAQGASPFKIVPPHYYAVMLETVTNSPGGFISFSQPVARGFPRRVIRLVPNRTFEGRGHVAIEMNDGLYSNIRFGFSYNYRRPDTFFFKFPWKFAQAHEKVFGLVMLSLEEGLSTSVRGHTLETLRRMQTQELAREILDRLHVEPDGKSRRTARQSLLDDFGIGDVRFWIAEIAPTIEMRRANEKENMRRIEIDTELYEEHAHVQCEVVKTDAHFELLERHCQELSSAEKADRIERRHETEALAKRGRLIVGRGRVAGLDDVLAGVGMLRRSSGSIGAAALRPTRPEGPITNFRTIEPNALVANDAEGSQPMKLRGGRGLRFSGR